MDGDTIDIAAIRLIGFQLFDEAGLGNFKETG